MENLSNFSTRIPEEIKKYLKIKAAKEGTNVQTLVCEIFTNWVNEQKGGNENE